MSTNVAVESDNEAGLRAWSKDYDEHVNNPPKEGDILTTPSSDTMVALVVELKEDNPPFIYGRAYVPEIVGHSLGWFLQSDTEENFHGWMCIILPRARTELIRKFGLQNRTIYVKSLKMVRKSQSGQALLCEIHEYGLVAKAEPEVVALHNVPVEADFEDEAEAQANPAPPVEIVDPAGLCAEIEVKAVVLNNEPVEPEVKVSEPMC